MPWDLAVLLAATVGDAARMVGLAVWLGLLLSLHGRVRRRRRWWLLLLPPLLWAALDAEGAR
jgi:hypothetical protein